MSTTSTSTTTTKDLDIREATLSELASLTTIVPRSFHPRNEFIKKCHPDTPAVREWWSKILSDEIESPDCHVLIATDPSAELDLAVVGVLCLRLMGPNDFSCGLWSQYPYTKDHDAVLFQPAIDAMLEGRTKAFTSPSEHAGKPSYLIELFGVDEKYQGRGLARKLLGKAGQIADESGVVTFVEANASAAGMYAKMGFAEQGTVELAGPNGGVYVEHMLIRTVGGSS